MQMFTAVLNETIDKGSLEQSWEIGNEHSPRVEFDFEGTIVRVTIFSNPEMPWKEANFKQMFSIAVHRVAPICEIQWN